MYPLICTFHSCQLCVSQRPFQVDANFRIQYSHRPSRCLLFHQKTKCQTLKGIIYRNVPHEANIQKWFMGHIAIGTSINLTKYKYSHEGGLSFCISFHLALNHIVSVSFARAGELFLYSSRSLWYYRRDDDLSCCLYVQLFRFPSDEVRRFQARL